MHIILLALVVSAMLLPSRPASPQPAGAMKTGDLEQVKETLEKLKNVQGVTDLRDSASTVFSQQLNAIAKEQDNVQGLLNKTRTMTENLHEAAVGLELNYDAIRKGLAEAGVLGSLTSPEMVQTLKSKGMDAKTLGQVMAADKYLEAHPGLSGKGVYLRTDAEHISNIRLVLGYVDEADFKPGLPDSVRKATDSFTENVGKANELSTQVEEIRKQLKVSQTGKAITLANSGEDLKRVQERLGQKQRVLNRRANSVKSSTRILSEGLSGSAGMGLSLLGALTTTLEASKMYNEGNLQGAEEALEIGAANLAIDTLFAIGSLPAASSGSALVPVAGWVVLAAQLGMSFETWRQNIPALHRQELDNAIAELYWGRPTTIGEVSGRGGPRAQNFVRTGYQGLLDYRNTLEAEWGARKERNPSWTLAQVVDSLIEGAQPLPAVGVPTNPGQLLEPRDYDGLPLQYLQVVRYISRDAKVGEDRALRTAVLLMANYEKVVQATKGKIIGELTKTKGELEKEAEKKEDKGAGGIREAGEKVKLGGLAGAGGQAAGTKPPLIGGQAGEGGQAAGSKPPPLVGGQAEESGEAAGSKPPPWVGGQAGEGGGAAASLFGPMAGPIRGQETPDDNLDVSSGSLRRPGSTSLDAFVLALLQRPEELALRVQLSTYYDVLTDASGEAGLQRLKDALHPEAIYVIRKRLVDLIENVPAIGVALDPDVIRDVEELRYTVDLEVPMEGIDGEQRQLKGTVSGPVYPLGLYQSDPVTARRGLEQALDYADRLWRVPQVALLRAGDYQPLMSFLLDNHVVLSLVDAQTPVADLENFRALVVPSGGLSGAPASFRSKLEEYASGGGRIIALSQQWGYDFATLPGGEVNGFGWAEDQSCQFASVSLGVYKPFLASQTRATPNFNVDGYFTTWPADAELVLNRTANGQPAMLLYPFGLGQVVASSLYSDWAFAHSQMTSDERALLRDLVSWALDPADLPVPHEVAPGKEVSFDLPVFNPGKEPVARVVFHVAGSDGASVGDVPVEASIPAGEEALVTFRYAPSASSAGIHTLDYTLLDTAGKSLYTAYAASRFAVSSYQANPDGFVYQAPDLLFTVLSDRQDYVLGSMGTFTMKVFNKGTSPQVVRASWASHRTPDGGEETLQVPAQGEASSSVTMPVVIRGNNRFDVTFRDGVSGQTLGEARKGFQGVAPTLAIKATPDKESYRQGETILVATVVRNTQPQAHAARLEYLLSDDSGRIIASANASAEAPPEQDVSLQQEVAIPAGALSGRYRVSVLATISGETAGAGDASLSYTAGEGTLAGRVINLATREPLPGASVKFVSGPHSATVTTGASGEYEVVLPGARYGVEITAAGFYRVTSRLVILPQETAQRDLYTAPLGSGVIPAGFGLLTGTVFTSSGDIRIPGAEVVMEGDIGNVVAITDENGRYEVVLPQGNYFLSVQLGGYAALEPIPMQVPEDQGMDQPLYVKAGQVSGKVLYLSSGSPVAGAQVKGDSGATATTRSDGSYSLLLAQGVHQLTVTPPEGSAVTMPVYAGGVDTPAPAIYVESVAPVPATVTVRDLYTNEPLAGADVGLVNVVLSGGEDPNSTIVHGGRFWVTVNGWLAFTESSELSAQKTLLPIQLALARGDELRVFADEAGGFQELSPLWLHNLATGEKVRLHPGVPRRDHSAAYTMMGPYEVFVDFRSTVGWDLTAGVAKTDASGKATLSLKPAALLGIGYGSWTRGAELLFAWKPGYEMLPASPVPVLAAAEWPAATTIYLQDPLVTLTGKVLGLGDDKPIAGTVLSFDEGKATSTADAQGGYSVTVARGVHQLALTAEGFQPVALNLQAMRPGQVRDFYLSPTDAGPLSETGEATVRVLNAVTGEPITGALVTGLWERGTAVVTDAKGIAPVAAPPGVFGLDVRMPGYGTAFYSATLDKALPVYAGRATQLTAYLMPVRGTIKFELRDLATGELLKGGPNYGAAGNGSRAGGADEDVTSYADGQPGLGELQAHGTNSGSPGPGAHENIDLIRGATAFPGRTVTQAVYLRDFGGKVNAHVVDALTGKPLAGVYVSLSVPETDAGGTVSSTRLAGPNPDTTVVEPRKPGYQTLRLSGFPTGSPGRIADITLPLWPVEMPPATLRGQVTGAGGRPAPQGTTARLDTQAFILEPDGSFTTSVPAGLHRLLVEAPGFPARERHFYLFPGRTERYDVSLASPEARTSFPVQVNDSVNGEPVVGARLVVTSAAGAGTVEETTDAAGRAEVAVPEGPFLLRLSAQGYHELEQSAAGAPSRGAALLLLVEPFGAEKLPGPPVFRLARGPEEPLSWLAGDSVQLRLRVANTGASLGQVSLSVSVPGIFQETKLLPIAPNAEEEVDFTFTVPEDMDSRSDRLRIALAEEVSEVPFAVQGATVAVEAALDQSSYRRGDTATFTMLVTNQTKVPLAAEARVQLGDFLQQRPLDLASAASTRLAFQVPVQFDGDKLLFGVYHIAGRSLYLNAYYLREKQDLVRLLPDRQQYRMEDKAMLAIEAEQPGRLTLTLPKGWTVEGPLTRDLAAGTDSIAVVIPPELTGTYFIEYEYGSGAELVRGRVPVDVLGYQVKVKSSKLSRPSFASSDTVDLVLRLDSSHELSARLGATVLDPLGRPQGQAERQVKLMPGLNDVEVSIAVGSSVGGVHSLAYSLEIDLPGHSPVVIASGSQLFDVQDTTAPALLWSRPANAAKDVPLSDRVMLTFIEPMNSASVEEAFQVEPAVVGSFSWLGSTLVFNPSAQLAKNTTYTVRVQGTARDLAGNAIGPAEVTFTTSAQEPKAETVGGRRNSMLLIIGIAAALGLAALAGVLFWRRAHARKPA